MTNIKEYIESGILELYVLGEVSPEEAAEVEEMSRKHGEVRKEIELIRTAHESYLVSVAAPTHPVLKSLLMTVIDYSDRIKRNGQAGMPPLLNHDSRIQDFEAWLSDPALIPPKDFRNIHSVIICNTPEVVTSVLWIKKEVPAEMHRDKQERFLILEGACNVIVEDKVYSLNSGNYFSIPLQRNHRVEVTSDIPCKAILQTIRVGHDRI